MMRNEEDFETLFQKSLEEEVPENGDIIKGVVVAIQKDFVLIDFGYKQEGQIPLSEFRTLRGKPVVKVGDTVEACLESLEGKDGVTLLSKEKADAFRAWDHLEGAFVGNKPIEATVLYKVKGGLTVEIEGVKAFLPASHIDLRLPGNLEGYVGRSFQCRILDLNKQKGNIIVSRRLYLEENQETVKQELLEKLTEGGQISGRVKNLTEFGAFIDLGGMDGLLHITDMSWGHLRHPSDLLKPGQEISVKVLKADPENGRISLGLKQLTPDPWESVPDKFLVGSTVKGRVVNVTDYGAFVELEEGVEGLIHVSEMSWSRKNRHPSKIVSEGDEVSAIVLETDVSARRISLSLRQVSENPWKKAAEQYPVGSRVKGTIQNVADFGVFVGLLPEVDGLIHVSDLSWVRSPRPISEVYKKGEEVEAVVLSVDQGGERFSLGLKQLSEDPWPRICDQYAIGTKHEGKIIWTNEKGGSVALENGIEAWLRRQEGLSLKIGEPVLVIVHSLDERDRKLLAGPVIKD